MGPQLPTPGYELPLKFAFQRALLTPQSSSLWHPSLAAQGGSGFRNGIVHGVPFWEEVQLPPGCHFSYFLFHSKIFKQPDRPTPSSLPGGTIWGSWSLSVWKDFPSMPDAR